MIEIRKDDPLTVEQFRDILVRSTLGERRPIDAPVRLQQMLEESDLTLTAYSGDTLVGIARCVTDFAYCCYLSDLAVDRAYQGKGIGKRLIAAIWQYIHADATLILLSAPGAVDFYPKVGFDRHVAAFVQKKQHS